MNPICTIEEGAALFDPVYCTSSNGQEAVIMEPIPSIHVALPNVVTSTGRVRLKPIKEPGGGTAAYSSLPLMDRCLTHGYKEDCLEPAHEQVED